MRGSEKGDAPSGVEEWHAIGGRVPKFADLYSAQKEELVDTLFREQNGCCIYCGRALKRKNFGTKSHVEHFRPQSKYPLLSLNHDNLFVSCGPEIDSGPSQTCGHVKGDWFDESHHIDPKDYPTARYFLFRSSGEIEDAGSSAARVMIDILKLNDPELVVDRRTLIDGVEQALLDGSEQEVLPFWNIRDDNEYEPGLSYVVRRYFDAA